MCDRNKSKQKCVCTIIIEKIKIFQKLLESITENNKKRIQKQQQQRKAFIKF